MPEIKILYLHVFEDDKSSVIRSTIEQAYGRENVTYPRLKNRKITIAFLLLLCVIYIASIYGCFWYLAQYTNFVYMLIPIWLLISTVILIPGIFLIYEIVYRKALEEAKTLFQDFSPNIIVTYHLGWTLATRIEGASLPMLLISPVQENLVSACFRKPIEVNKYPYIIFIHTNNDKKYNLNATLKLIESGNKNNCRVEIVDGGNNLGLLTDSDYKSWIDEIYYEGVNNKKKEVITETESKENESKENEPTNTEEQTESEKKPLLSKEV